MKKYKNKSLAVKHQHLKKENGYSMTDRPTAISSVPSSTPFAPNAPSSASGMIGSRCMWSTHQLTIDPQQLTINPQRITIFKFFIKKLVAKLVVKYFKFFLLIKSIVKSITNYF